MKLLRKSMSILLSLIMIVSLFTIIPFSASAAISVDYIDENGDLQTAYNVAPISDLGGGGQIPPGWYAVTSNTSFRYNSYCYGDMHLILCDGYTFNIPRGIEASGRITIYGQSNNTGKLLANENNEYYNTGIESKDIVINGGTIIAKGGTGEGVAIGGRYGTSSVTINGGDITAYGCDNSDVSSAGIGGRMGVPGKITINGGTINATAGSYCAAIGGCRGAAGEVTINGGNITANGGYTAAALGGGDGGSGTVVINGGKVTARVESATALGGGHLANGNVTITGGEVNAFCTTAGTGIGGGIKGDCVVNISGGKVTVTGGEYAVGIGCGSENTADINISGGDIQTSVGEKGVGIGCNKDANPADTSINLSWTDKDADRITADSYNGVVTLEKAFTDGITKHFAQTLSDNSIIAGKTLLPYEMTGKTYTVTWKNYNNSTLKTDTGVAEGSRPSYTGATPTKPDDEVYSYTFAGWTDGEKTYAANEPLPHVSEDVVYTAVFTPSRLDSAIDYIDDDGTGKFHVATPLTSTDTNLSEGWYAVTENITISERINCSGDVRIILVDGYTLTAPKGITVSAGVGNLTIYGQSGATGTLQIDNIDYGCAGIGGGFGADIDYDLTNQFDSGIITINGGTVNVNVGLFCTGIGGGYKSVGFITINGGRINISGDQYQYGSQGQISGNGIGDGPDGSGSTITLGWLNAETDSIYAIKYSGTVTLSKMFTDGQNNIYNRGMVNNNDTLKNVTLIPYQTYTVTWENYDGTVLETDEFVLPGTYPTYDGNTPLKVADESCGYIFAGWSPEVSAVTGDVTYTAQFEPAAYVPAVAPYIDENGAYILGTKEHYEVGGKSYAVNQDSSVGEEISDLSLSYFDFRLNGDTYQIAYYTGPPIVDELVIPKTFNGKAITVIGNNDNNRLYETGKTQFSLVLNENITEIRPYTFYVLYVTKITGDTSALNRIGSFAFSWANGPGDYKVDVKLDYKGTITVGVDIFNHDIATLRIKHGTKFSSTSFSARSVDYVFTDDHTYGEPVWTWADDYSTATAKFTCADSRCHHEETVNATITSETKDGIITYTATADFDGSTYTDTKTAFADGIGARVIGHSISLDGDIAVNFYIELASEIAQSQTAYMQFIIPTGDKTETKKIFIKDITPKGSYYVFKCNVAAKEMASIIKARIYEGETPLGAEYTYSVEEYANYLLAHTGDNTEYAKAESLVRAMLQYGDYAKEYFDKSDTLDNLDDVTIDSKFAEFANTLPENLYDGTTLSLKSQTSLSLYFTSGDDLTFSCVDKNGKERTVETVRNVNTQIARIRNIAAKEFQDNFTVNVKKGETLLGTITYSPMNYCYKVLDGGTQDRRLVNVIKALYQYSQEANEYFK